MNTVEPIRDINTVWDIADYLGEKSERNKIMFLFGIYVGIRVSDILSLKVRDVRDMNYVSIREMKTGKEKRFPINEELRPLLNRYIKGKADYEPLFPSRQQNKALSRCQAYNILSTAGEKFGLQHIGTHTMRKTFRDTFLPADSMISVTLQKIFNHDNTHITMRYIGLEQDAISESIMKLSFKKRR